MGRIIRMLLWGHSLADYKQMFALSDEDLTKTILDYGAGPASFNAEMTQNGGHVISCDEAYHQSAADLDSLFQSEFAHMQKYIEMHRDKFHWDAIGDHDALKQDRTSTMNKFIKDFAEGKAAGRYRHDVCPDLGFSDNQFDIIVASHAMFITHADKEPEYLVEAIIELCRVGNDIRLFPLLDSDGNNSPLVGPVLLAMQHKGYNCEVREVDYHFQKGGNAMLRIITDD